MDVDVVFQALDQAVPRAEAVSGNAARLRTSINAFRVQPVVPLRLDPLVVHLDQPLNNVLLNLAYFSSAPNRSSVTLLDPHPRLSSLLDKDDLVLAVGERVANDDLVPVALQGRACLWDQQVDVGFELGEGNTESARSSQRTSEEAVGSP